MLTDIFVVLSYLVEWDEVTLAAAGQVDTCEHKSYISGYGTYVRNRLHNSQLFIHIVRPVTIPLDLLDGENLSCLDLADLMHFPKAAFTDAYLVFRCLRYKIRIFKRPTFSQIGSYFPPKMIYHQLWTRYLSAIGAPIEARTAWNGRLQTHAEVKIVPKYWTVLTESAMLRRHTTKGNNKSVLQCCFLCKGQLFKAWFLCPNLTFIVCMPFLMRRNTLTKVSLPLVIVTINWLRDLSRSPLNIHWVGPIKMRLYFTKYSTKQYSYQYFSLSHGYDLCKLWRPSPSTNWL
jgi:hypothetical protein